MKLSLLSIFLFILSIQSCNYSNEWKEISVENKFSISVPGFFKEDKGLRKDASFQYANRYRNIYAIVIEHDKSNKTLYEMDESVIQPLLKYIDKPIVTDSIDTKINGLNARQNKVMGTMPSGDATEFIYYNHVLIEGKKKFYEVCTWTRGPKRKDLYDADLTRIIFSFKEK